MSYTVINAMKTGGYDSKYGPMTKYAVQFEGMDDTVELAQKPETAAPKAGDTLEGTIEDTPYGKRFKKAQTASGGFQRGGKSQEELEQNLKLEVARNQSIQRQKAADLAVQLVLADKREDLSKAFDEVLMLIAPKQIKTPDQELDAAILSLGGEEVDNLPEP